MQEQLTSFTIKQWSDDDKPREKLLRKGRSVVSNAELLALLIGSGSKRENAVILARKILAEVDNDLAALGRLSVAQLMQFEGIGEAKAVTIAAALEIGRRRQGTDIKAVSRINSSSDAYKLLFPMLSELAHEEFWIVYLNNSHRVLHIGQLSKGGITGTLVDIRLAMRQALEYGAVALILAHNHPSGTLKPSRADKEITAKLKTASEALDIRILDHIILGQQQYFSFADSGML
ncbi:RadC family protein [Poritiphilus flavus]|uniref:DNA repair protein RadC n=1 Tax=Poritiphilus flavus TaxID=2697053 RepID=A0A6L9EHP8_9FLAO|nr:DNA repair protein RadC [Poritiphilus flavus]NAS14182.1 DNA repair protein RadC [Poritiphilus flavus]